MFKKQWPAFLLAFVLPLVLVYGWWGGFNSAHITRTESGPYRYAYLDYEGPISGMRKTQKQVLQAFVRARTAEGDTITVLLTDPRNPGGKVRAHVGYLLASTAPVPQGLTGRTIPRRLIVAAKVRAAILLAPSKAYKALHDYLQTRGEAIRMPTVEIFRPGARVTEMGEFTLEMNR